MSMRRAFETRKRHRTEVAIDAVERAKIEESRLVRMIDAISCEPSQGERARLRFLMKSINAKSRVDQAYIGTVASPLDASNLNLIDPSSFASLLPAGIDALLARVTTQTPAHLRAMKRAEHPEEAVDEDDIAEETTQDASDDRYDTMLLITQDNRVRAVKHVLVQNEAKKMMFGGRLILRMIQLSEDVRLRINTAHNVHQREYLDYYTNLDEAAAREGVDVRDDEHQVQYDQHYEVTFAVSDCLHVHSRMVNKSYLERVTLVHNLTETNVAQDTTQAVKRRLEMIRYAVKYAGGEDKFQMTVFLLPIWRIRDIRAAMHAVPACLQGCAIDGVMFHPNEAAFVCGRNARLLHYSPRYNTVTEDAVVKYVAGEIEKLAMTNKS